MKSYSITTREPISVSDKPVLAAWATEPPVVDDDITAFDYALDPTRIAAAPGKRRDQSRLLIYDRKTGIALHQRFSSLIDFLHPNDTLVVNNTRVFPARLLGRSVVGGGGKFELLLLRPVDLENQRGTVITWEALVKGHLTEKTVITLNGGGRAYRVSDFGLGRNKMALELPNGIDIYAYLEQWGEVPLPPYILRRRKASQRTSPTLLTKEDRNRYQTVYAEQIGSVAAPTAGLHLTQRLIAAIQKKGVTVATVTLHIGIDTFKPIGVDKIRTHEMSGERFEVPNETVRAIEKTRRLGGKVIAVGTSVTRSLESATDEAGTILPTQSETKLFISPGYRFRVVDALVTNLHPPRSTGLALVSAFASRETLLSLYRQAIDRQYRFFSYGDAMLIL